MKRVIHSPELSVVMPTYNNSGVVNESIDNVEAAVKKIGVDYEIIVVDDGSMDDTRTKAVTCANRNGHVKVFGYKKNMGKGYAVRTGFQHAKGSSVIFIDSDLDIDPIQIFDYFQALKRGYIVIASKWHPQSSVRTSFLRKILSKAFNRFARFLTGIKIRDTQTGLKAVRKRALEGVFSSLAVNRYAYDVELLALAKLYGMKIVELPVTIRRPKSRIFPASEICKMFFDLLKIAIRLRLLRNIAEKRND